MLSKLWTLLCLLLALIYCISADESVGSTLFQCPNGYFLSKFNTAFDGTERYYKFSCSKFSGVNPIDEVCSMSDVASTEDEDIYMSCGSEQYTTGIEILENPSSGATTWQLLCCTSEAVSIRNDDCIDTKFINDLRRPSSFSSGSQIIRKWQAMTENSDLRWWLQLCPVDVSVKKAKTQQIRARRQLPRGWSRGRFAPLEFYPAYMGHNRPLVSQERFYEQKRLQEIEKTNQIQAMFPLAAPMLITTTRPPVEKNSEFNSNKAETKDELKEIIENRAAFVTEVPATTKYSKSFSREDTAIDYYDTYDDNFDKAKHEGKGGFLSGVSDLLQNLQDGISLAQAVMPGNNNPVFTTKAPLTDSPSFLLSHDENSLTIGLQENGPNKHFDSIVKLQKFGPNPARPPSTQTTTPTAVKLGDPSAIQQMLQFFGLCKGHEL